MLGAAGIGTRIHNRHQKNKIESPLTDQYENDGSGQGKGDTMD